MASPLPSMAGKVVLITGATGGIGRETALGLARLGATVVGVGRSIEKNERTCAGIRAETSNENVHYLTADLFSLAQVLRLAEDFRGRFNRLDVLINNAGSMFWEFDVSADDIERTFALNHLSHFVLTNALLDMLKASAPSRILHISSVAHHAALTADQMPHKFYRLWYGFPVYAESKLANVLFSNELARRIEGTGVTSNALHPGFVDTGFGRNGAWYASGFMAAIQRVGAISPREGAANSIWLAAAPELAEVSGKYFRETEAVAPSRLARDEQAALRLWERSERLAAAILTKEPAMA